MSTFSRALLILALLVAASIARSDGIYNPGGRGVGFTDGINNGGAAAGPPGASGKILLVDGTSFLLQTDGASKVCRAGGC